MENANELKQRLQQHCAMCGDCCRIISFFFIRPDAERFKQLVTYYKTRGCLVRQKQGEIFEVAIPLICPELIYSAEINKWLCALHGTRKMPKLCKDYNGQKEGFFVPDNCAMREDK